MIMRLLHELDKEYSELNQRRMKLKSERQEKLNEKVQNSKHKNEQALYNRNIKDLDAAYKLIAYRIARHYHPEKDVPKPPGAFDFYYEKRLQEDIQKPPRPVIAHEYEPKYVSKFVHEEIDSDDEHASTYIRTREENRQMYERMDVKQIIDYYEEDKQQRKEASLVTKTFLEDYFGGRQDPDFLAGNYEEKDKV